MTNPLNDLLNEFQYSQWANPAIQNRFKQAALQLGVPGLVDVRFTDEPERFRITPVFATEQDWVWYNLKYGNSL